LQVAETVYDMLVAGGSMAMVVHTVEGRPRPPSPGHPPIPHEELQELVVAYLGADRRMGQGFAPVRDHKFEDILVRTRFGAPRVVFAPGVSGAAARHGQRHLRLPLACLHPRRICSATAWTKFVVEARSLLQARSEDGLFWGLAGRHRDRDRSKALTRS